MAEEVWKPVLGYEGLYEVSDLGRVKGYHRRCLRQYEHPFGYNDVDLYKNRVKTKKKVHRLVLEAFVGACPEGMECRHLNGQSRDNRLENLRWGTKAENFEDRVRHGTILKGERHPGVKLTEDQVREIRSAPGSQSSIAARYGVEQTNISAIKRWKSWACVA